MSFDLSNYEVGDEFDTSPHELGRIISAILAESGSFKYEGSTVVITSLPNRKTKAVITPEPEPISPPAPEPAPEPEPEPEVKTFVAKTPSKIPTKAKKAVPSSN